MHFFTRLKNKISKKSLISLLSFGVVLGIAGCGEKPSSLREDTKATVSPIILTIPEGASPKEKMSKYLSETEGLEGTLDFQLHLADKDNDPSTWNVISVNDASLRLAKPKKGVFGLDLEMEVDYNGVSKSAHLNHADDTTYLNLAGLTYRYTDTTYKSLIGKIISIFGVDAIKVPDTFYDLLDRLSPVSGNHPESSFELIEEPVAKGFSFKVSLSSENEIHLLADEEYNLTRIYGDKLTFGNHHLSFSFETLRNDDELTVIKSLAPSDGAHYTELYDTMDLVRKIKNLTTSRKFGIKIEGNVHHNVSETNHHSASEEDILLDACAYFDIDATKFSGTLSAHSPSAASTSNLVNFVSEKEEGVQKTYLNYNDVLQFGVTSTVLNEMIARLKEDFSNGVSFLDKLFDLLDQICVSNIKNGHYEAFLGAIKSLSNDGNVLSMTFNLEDFGLGEESEMIIKVDGNRNQDLVTIYADGVGLSGYLLQDTTITLTDYQETSMNTEGYYFLEKLPTIYDQVKEIVEQPKFHLGIEASYVDSHGVGLSSLNGSAYLLGTMNGSNAYEFQGGNVELDLIQQIGVKDKNGNFSSLGERKNHHIVLDLEALDNAYFHYYDAGKVDSSKADDGTWGKIEINPFKDVIDIVKEIYNSEDSRFSKWFKVVETAAAANVIDALKSGQYSPLLASNLVISSSFATSFTEIVISGLAFGLNDENGDNNFTLRLDYNDKNEVESISIKNLVLNGSTLNLTLTISDYIEGKMNILDHSQCHTDLTGLSPFIKDLYNTANMNTFHLTGSQVGMKILFFKIYLDMDFRIFMDGAKVKVYGIINVPCIVGVNGGNLLKTYYRTVVFYFDDIDPETGDAYEDNHGYVYLTYNKSTTKGQISGGTEEGAYKYHSDYFKGGSQNLLHFIFKDVMGFSDSIYNQIVSNDSSDTAGKAVNYENVLEEFTYAKSEKKWVIGIDLEALTNIGMLKNFTGTFYAAPSSAHDNKDVLSKLEIKLSLSLLITLNVTGTFYNTDLGVLDNWAPVDQTYQRYIDAHRKDACDYQG